VTVHPRHRRFDRPALRAAGARPLPAHTIGSGRKSLDAHYADAMIPELNVYAEADQC
jgi:hypothetical protein